MPAPDAGTALPADRPGDARAHASDPTPPDLEVFDHLADPVYVSDPTTYELLFVNQAVRRVLGPPAGRTCYAYLQGRNTPCPFCTNHLIFGKHLGRTHVWEFRNEVNGRWYKCCDRAIPWSDGRRVRFEMAIDIHEQKHLAETLRETARIAQVGGWEIDLAGNTVTWTEETFRIHARDASRPPSVEEALAYYHPDDRDRVAAVVQSAIDRREGFDIEARLVTDAGSIRWVRAIGTAVSRGGSVTGLRCMVQDITAFKRVEDEKRQGQLIADSIPVGLHVYRLEDLADDRTLRMVYANPASASLTGLPPDAVIGRTLDENFPGLRAKGIPQCYAAVVRRQTPVAFDDFIYGDDRVMQAAFAIQAFPLPDGCVGVAFENITERKRNEAALRASEENLRVTLDSIGDAVIATDADGRITRMNQVAERLTAWPVAEAAGRPLLQVFRIVNAHSRAPVEDPAAKVRASGEIVGLANHTVLIARDGTEYQIADSGAPIRSSTGSILGVVLVFRDVTAEYALQEQVRQSQKMDAIGQLAGGIAHDFNNMLGGIMGAADLLSQRLGGDQYGAQYVTMIQESSERAASLTAKLLAFARRQPLAPVPVDAHLAVQAAVAILRRTIDRQIRIEVVLDPAPATVLGDLAQLEGVFLNLGINAAHAMPHGGRLSFRSQRTDANGVEILVEDTGCGIAAQHLPRIFEPFFTTKASGMGTGLGLSASLGTVQQCGGTIEVTSTIGVGTLFRVRLPTVTCQAQAAPVTPRMQRGTGLILVVDDEPALRAICRSILESCGYHVLEAENGAAAIDLVRNVGQDIDLVILDMIMPVMGGRDCFARLREIKPGLKTLLVSGYSHMDDLQELRQQGLAGLVAKPFRMAELSQAVAEALRGRPRHPSQPVGDGGVQP